MANITTAVAGSDLLAADVNQRNKREIKIQADETIAAGDLCRIIDNAGISRVKKILESGVGSTLTFPEAEVDFTTNAVSTPRVAYGSVSGEFVVSYVDTTDGSKGKAVVGNISGDTVTFGTPVTFEANGSNEGGSAPIVYDSNADKYLIMYRDSIIDDAFGIVGTVSGTSISFGSRTLAETDPSTNFALAFDNTLNKSLFIYNNIIGADQGYGIVATISGTSVSFGTRTSFHPDFSTNTSVTFDSTAGKFGVFYRDDTDSQKGKAVVATISGTSVSFGAETQFSSGTKITVQIDSEFSPDDSKILVAWNNTTDGNMDGVVGTISGTSISFGTIQTIQAGGSNPSITYDTNKDKFIVFYFDTTLDARVGTMSGTSMTYDTAVEVNTEGSSGDLAYGSTPNRTLFVYPEQGDSDGSSRVGSVGGATLFADEYFCVASEAITTATEGFLTAPGGYNELQSGMTPGAKQYISATGTLTEVDAGNGVAGRAIDATTLFVFPNNIV